MSLQKAPLPWWQVNVPPSHREESCPDYLADLSTKDQRIIGTPDEEFEPMQWPQVKELIHANRLDHFERKPSELRKYRAYVYSLIKEHGSVMNFVLSNRLEWEDLTPTAAPFCDTGDYKILCNDWPYGIDSSIVHLIVWSKFGFEDDPEVDELTPRARSQIDDFVKKTFCAALSPGDVIWFRNWRSLKSVHAIEHFHVMLNGPAPEFVRKITNDDIPLTAKAELAGELPLS